MSSRPALDQGRVVIQESDRIQSVIEGAVAGCRILDRAPEVVDALAPWLPADWRSRAGGLLAGSHAGLAPAGLPVGLDASAVRPDRTPLAAIAMVDAAGELGLLGRGLYLPPAALFIGAVGAVGLSKAMEAGSDRAWRQHIAPDGNGAATVTT
ncbi:hypothetical protein D3C72_1678040 [compost metagenome]